MHLKFKTRSGIVYLSKTSCKLQLLILFEIFAFDTKKDDVILQDRNQNTRGFVQRSNSTTFLSFPFIRRDYESLPWRSLRYRLGRAIPQPEAWSTMILELCFSHTIHDQNSRKTNGVIAN
jgi:hypothetical protein